MQGDTDAAVRGNGANEDRAIDWEKAQRGAKLLLEAVGAEPESERLAETWQRRVPCAFETLSEGRREEAKPAMRTFPAESGDLVVKTGIPLYSLCEHHLLPYHGVAHVGYEPDGEVVGLSKLPRYVRWQSRRLTMQESLTHELASGLREEMGASGVVVEIEATHLCEAMRGVERATETTTRATAGDLPSDAVRRFERAIDTAHTRHP
jgi:GTP cyclohydrolase I